LEEKAVSSEAWNSPATQGALIRATYISENTTKSHYDAKLIPCQMLALDSKADFLLIFLMSRNEDLDLKLEQQEQGEKCKHNSETSGR
jgi:hypothetical protein